MIKHAGVNEMFYVNEVTVGLWARVGFSLWLGFGLAMCICCLIWLYISLDIVIESTISSSLNLLI